MSVLMWETPQKLGLQTVMDIYSRELGKTFIILLYLCIQMTLTTPAQ